MFSKNVVTLKTALIEFTHAEETLIYVSSEKNAQSGDRTTMNPSIIDLLIYVPAKDFEMSKLFYAALGFEMTEGWGGTLDCRLGGASFRLQNYYVRDWADNFMMRFGVEDVHAWYEHAKKVVAEGDFGNARVSEPEMAGDTPILHVHDPSGVLLIFVG